MYEIEYSFDEGLSSLPSLSIQNSSRGGNHQSEQAENEQNMQRNPGHSILRIDIVSNSVDDPDENPKQPENCIQKQKWFHIH